MKTKRIMLLTVLVLGVLLEREAQAFYNPGTGRWLSRDPIGERGGINLLSCIGNNLINEIDRLGLDYFGNPVSGPNGPVGPSIPYNPGWPNYPDGYLYTPGNPDPSFIGAEILLGKGGLGATTVTCCDDRKRLHVMTFIKICYGRGAGASASIGKVTGMKGIKCDPNNYKGPFIEGSLSVGFLTAGVDLGVSSDGFTGVNDIGGGIGVGTSKSMVCYYYLINDDIKPCGCK